jgi:hypothetical protein
VFQSRWYEVGGDFVNIFCAGEAIEQPNVGKWTPALSIDDNRIGFA